MNTSPTVGRRLKDERERRDLQRVDVSRATKIYVHHLAALEFGRYDDLPDERVVESYVRAYAEQVGLDGEALVRDLRVERGLPGPEPPPAPPARSHRAWWLFAGGAVVLAAIAIGWSGKPERSAEVVAPRAAPPPPPAPEPIPDPVLEAPAPDPDPTLTVAAHGVGTGVVDHRLVGAGDRFSVGTEVWFWTDVRGAAPGATIRHLWIHEGRRVFELPLRLGGASWRTQSSRPLRAGSAGAWTVEARDERGRTVARDTFECVP